MEKHLLKFAFHCFTIKKVKEVEPLLTKLAKRIKANDTYIELIEKLTPAPNSNFVAEQRLITNNQTRELKRKYLDVKYSLMKNNTLGYRISMALAENYIEAKVKEYRVN